MDQKAFRLILNQQLQERERENLHRDAGTNEVASRDGMCFLYPTIIYPVTALLPVPHDVMGTNCSRGGLFPSIRK